MRELSKRIVNVQLVVNENSLAMTSRLIILICGAPQFGTVSTIIMRGMAEGAQSPS